MKVKLIPLIPSPDEYSVSVAGPRFVIGRADDCDLRLESALVSRYHCELIIGDDVVIVRELGSSNGTFVNSERVWSEMPLADGDLLGIAANTYQLHIRVPSSRSGLLSRMSHAVVRALCEPIGAGAHSGEEM